MNYAIFSDMTTSERIRCEYRQHGAGDWSGLAIIVPNDIWPDFQSFLNRKGVRGRNFHNVLADGERSHTEFFPDAPTGAAELHRNYLADLDARRRLN
jgi:hypothetical protein